MLEPRVVLMRRLMAARSSFTRTESRWGLYHDRADMPERDDERWRRRQGCREMRWKHRLGEN